MEHQEIYKQYLKKLKIENHTTLHDLEAIFLLARKEFYDYKISLDQFSKICEDLWKTTHESKELGNSNLALALESGAELSFFVRQRPKEDARQLNYFLQYIHDYTKET